MSPSLPLPSVILVLLPMLYLAILATSDVPVSLAQVAPKAVNTRIVETTRAGLDLGSRTTQVTEPTTNVTTTAITGGTRPTGGPNLFHSFDFFTVGSKDIAHFQNDMMLPTTNIIARVIGDAAGLRETSTIDGILRTNNPLNAFDPLNFGAANLYLVNPAGIIFGPNAQLDIKGSFAAATADYLRMTDGAQFHTDPIQPSVLSIANVAAFGFTNPRPVAISVQESVLTVSAGHSLAIVGGDINITGGPLGFMAAEGGQIQLASVASAGEVVTSVSGTPGFNVDSFTQLGPIQISQQALLDTSGNPGGTVLIRGGNLTVDNSFIFSATLGNAATPRLGLDIRVTGNILLKNRSRLLTTTLPNQGRAGDVIVEAGGAFEARGASRIESAASGRGIGGNLQLTADSIRLTPVNDAGVNTNFATSLSAGNATITAGTFQAVDGARVLASQLSGDSAFPATITLHSDSALLSGTTTIGGQSGGGGLITQVGNGPTLMKVLVETGSLEILNGGTITASAAGSENAGQVDINANSILLSGVRLVQPSQIDVSTRTVGKSGSVTITTDSLEIRDGARITADAIIGPAGAGSIDISATDHVLVSGVGQNVQASITAGGPVSAGRITVDTPNLEVRNGRIMLNSTTGRGGNLSVDAQNISLFQQGRLDASGAGGGSIVLNGETLSLDASTILANTTGNLTGTPVGVEINATDVLLKGSSITTNASAAGAAGDLRVTATTVDIQGNSSLRSNPSAAGNGGNITVRAMDEIRLVDLGQISTSTGGASSGKGGNITIDADTLLVSGGRIVSNVFTPSGLFVQSSGSGSGGNLTIEGDNFELRAGGLVSAVSFGSGDGGSIQIAADRVLLTPGDRDGLVSSQPTRILARTVSGQPGSIDIAADTVEVFDGAQISTTAIARSPGGDLKVTADRILLSGRVQAADGGTTPAGLFSSTTGTLAQSGRGGNIEVKTQELTIQNGASISVSSQGRGESGSIAIDADKVSVTGVRLDNGARISAQTEFQEGGKGGNISVNADLLEVKDGGAISVSTLGAGDAGVLSIHAKSVIVSGEQAGRSSRLLGETTAAFGGKGGAVSVNADIVEIKDGGIVSVATFGSGVGGNLNLHAPYLIIAGGAVSGVTRGSSTGGTLTFVGDNLTITDNGLITSATTGSGNGGNINLNVGSLSAQSAAQITSSSVGTATGRAGSITVQGLNGAGSSAQSLSLTGANTSITSDTDNTGRGGDIQIRAGQVQLADLASLTAETSGTGRAGSIGVTSDNLSVIGGARIEASTAGLGNAGDITITNTDTVSVSGLSSNGSTRSGIFAKTQTSGGTAGGGSGGGSGGGGGGSGGGQVSTAGNAGNIGITTNNLLLSGGAQIDGSTTTAGAGGSVSVNADSIMITGTSTRLTSDAPRGNGTGGDIALIARAIGVHDKASVTAATGGTGNAGDITMTASENFTLDSGATVTTSTRGSGAGGTILINSPQVLVDGLGTSITADTLRPFADLAVTLDILHPNDGDLTVRLDSPDGTRVALLSRVGGSGDHFTGTILDDQATGAIASGSAPFTGLFRPREPLAQLIDQDVAGTWKLNVSDQAAGNTGNPQNLQSWSLRVGNQVFQSTNVPQNIPDNGSVSSNLVVAGPVGALIQGVGEAPGVGGDVTINAGTVTVQNGASLSATTRGSGKGGTLIVNASGPVAVTGSGSGLFTDSEASGTGGNINVTASSMSMSNGATVSAASSGAGDAGTITLNAGSQFLSTNGSVTTESLNASGGNITLLATDMVHLKNSQISASVQGGPDTTGGNILIHPQFVILQNSQIIAQAFLGQGGNINIVTNTFLPDANSLVSASSQFGLSGTVSIQAPLQNLSGALVPLRADYLRSAALLGQRCAARGADAPVSTFLVTEHEGLPQEPGGVLPSPLGFDEVVTSESSTIGSPSVVTAASQPLQFAAVEPTCRR